MKTFFAFLESEDLDDLENILGGFEDLGLMERKWDDDQIRKCLGELNWDDALVFEVEDYFIDWRGPNVKTKTNLNGSEFEMKPDIEVKIGASLELKPLAENLSQKLLSLPKTTESENLFTMEEILRGLMEVRWNNIWSDFMDDVSDNYKSWVKIKMDVEVGDISVNYPIKIETQILFDDSDQAPFKMKDWDHINRVMEKIYILS
jgi:hypothetical protein